MTKKRERGREAAIRKREMTLSKCEQMPGPSSQAEIFIWLDDKAIIVI